MRSKIREIQFDARPKKITEILANHFDKKIWKEDASVGIRIESLVLAQSLNVHHDRVLRGIDNCRQDIMFKSEYRFDENFSLGFYYDEIDCRLSLDPKFFISEFGMALLVVHINSSKARQIASEIFYRLFILRNTIDGFSDEQTNSVRRFFRKQMRKEGKVTYR